MALEEEWQDVAIAPGYKISSWGRLYSPVSHGPHKPGIKNGWVTVRGYRSYVLRDESGKRIERAAHVLVANAFLGPRPEGLWVLHWDDDGLNNCLSNLRHGTPKENAADALRLGNFQQGERHVGSRLKATQVHEIRHLLMTTDMGYAEIGGLFNVKLGAIRSIYRGQTWKHLETPGWEPFRGAKASSRHITPLQWDKMKSLLDYTDMTGREISRRVGISEMVVSDIKHGRRVRPVERYTK